MMSLISLAFVPNSPEALPQALVADVLVHQDAGLGDDVVDRTGDLGVDVVGETAGGLVTLADEQIEDVQGNGDIAGQDFHKLPVGLIEGGRLVRLDVEHANDPVVQPQRHGQ